MSGLINKIKNATHHNHNNAPVANNVEALPTGFSSQQGRTVVNAPIIQETVRQDRIIDVQPVIHRDVEQDVIHHVEQHIREPAAPTMGGIIERPPIVQQSMHTNVVNEVQPVIHRERAVPVAVNAEKHLSEHFVAPPVHTHEVVYENRAGHLPAQTVVNDQQKHGLFHRH